MSVKRNQLTADIDKIAAHLAKRIIGDDPVASSVDVAEEISGLRALTNYLAVKNKLDPPNKDEKGAFDEYSESVAGAGGRGNGRGRPAASAHASPDDTD